LEPGGLNVERVRALRLGDGCPCNADSVLRIPYSDLEFRAIEGLAHLDLIGLLQHSLVPGSTDEGQEKMLLALNE